MHFIPERRTGPELLDLPPESYTVEELEGSLRDITIVNRYLGDNRAILKHVSRLTAGTTLDRLTVLDIGTGSADIPVAIARWGRKTGVHIEITGIDNNPQTIEIARKRVAGEPGITLAVADGLNLPFPDKSFDYVLCSKTLHHFTNDQAVRLIREAGRVARRGYLIMDLRRSWIACVLIYILTRLFSGNRLTRNDGPLSVLRAYTPAELGALARTAGAAEFTIVREPFWLMVLTGGSG
jgi:SAM-dependent methyltransferase